MSEMYKAKKTVKVHLEIDTDKGNPRIEIELEEL